ncbi:MAG: guanylate kinase [Christensenellaceae bacterium]|nr:guanylate kinase [Christensenellaceae bacterium]
MKKGLLVVISGPSGVGKGTIIKRILDSNKNTSLSVSCTTREPRPGEQDGVHYWFIKKDEFERMIKDDQFLEYMPVFDNFYGTPKDKVEQMRKNGIDVILDIDVKGAQAVKNKANDAVMIFILPPTLETLKERLSKRGTETQEQIEKRFSRAKDEIEKSSLYDYQVVNDSLDAAVKEVENILEKEHLKK